MNGSFSTKEMAWMISLILSLDTGMMPVSGLQSSVELGALLGGSLKLKSLL